MASEAQAEVGFLLSGAGNRFVLVDSIAGGLPPDPAHLARALCSRVDPPLDGLLLLTGAPGAPRMVVFNRDGSRPEACGNGLRCLAHHALAAGHVVGPEFTVETESGARAVRVTDAGLATCLGQPRSRGPATVTLGGECVELVHVEIGNPHAVVFMGSVTDADVARVGSALQGCELFERGVNAEFAVPARDSVQIHARVWERGVGETAACGTGAAAVLVAARERLGWGARARVCMPGGVLEVSVDADGAVWALGPVEVGGRIPIDLQPTGGSKSPPEAGGG